MTWKETTSPKTFTSQPEPPYLTIDFWQKGSDLYKCIKARTAAQAFSEDDWMPATPAEEAKSEAQAAITAAGEAKGIAEKTANHVFADSEGLHVSSEEGDASQGWNTLLSSQGMAVRDGQDPELEIGSHETSVQKWSHLNTKNPLWISSEAGSVSITGVDAQGNPTELGIGIVENANGGIDALIQAENIYLGNGSGRFGKLEDWVVETGHVNGLSYQLYASGLKTRLDDSGWIDLWVANNITVRARRLNGWVFVMGESYNVKTITTDWTSITTLPEGFRPGNTAYTAGSKLSGSDTGVINFRAAPSGIVSGICPGSSWAYWTFSMSFPEGA